MHNISSNNELFILISHLWRCADVAATDRMGERGTGGHEVAELDSKSIDGCTLRHQDAATHRPAAAHTPRGRACALYPSARDGRLAHVCGQVRGHAAASLGRASLNPLWLALCWNSHRLSKQSNSGSIRPSIGGIETELVVSRGQEILTRALCRLPAGGRTYTHLESVHKHTHTHTHTHTDSTAEDLLCYKPQIFVNACIQIYEHTLSSSSTHICLATHSNADSRPPWDTNYLHTDTAALISYEHIQVLSVQVGAVCQQFVSK